MHALICSSHTVPATISLTLHRLLIKIAALSQQLHIPNIANLNTMECMAKYAN